MHSSYESTDIVVYVSPPNLLQVGFYSHTLQCAFISVYLARYAGPDRAASSCVLPTQLHIER